MAREINKKRALVLTTGGTLSMRKGSDGHLKPDTILEDLLTWVPELNDYADIRVEIMDNIDSSQAKPDLWLRLARRVDEAQDRAECDGVVILHGTDTLAWTASALSFLLPSLTVPVVITGSQRPLAVTRTDARNNIIGAMESALEGPLEVMVFFNHKAFRGNRVIKSAIGDFDGFGSPNYPPLGLAGISWQWFPSRFWPETRRPTMPQPIPDELPPTPLVLPWLPGLDFTTLESIFNSQWAVILEAFGTGNMPFDHSMKTYLGQFIKDGGLVFIRSQVSRGRVMPAAYEPGKVLEELGIKAGCDMTREAMVTKLMMLKGLGFSNDRIRRQMTRSLAGEMCEDAEPYN